MTILQKSACKTVNACYKMQLNPLDSKTRQQETAASEKIQKKYLTTYLIRGRIGIDDSNCKQ